MAEAAGRENVNKLLGGTNAQFHYQTAEMGLKNNISCFQCGEERGKIRRQMRQSSKHMPGETLVFSEATCNRNNFITKQLLTSIVGSID